MGTFYYLVNLSSSPEIVANCVTFIAVFGATFIVVVLLFLMLHKIRSLLYVVVVLFSCIGHNCFVGLFVYCVVFTFPCGRTSQDRLYKHDTKTQRTLQTSTDMT